MKRNVDKKHYFEKIAAATSDELSLASGTQRDRLVGLERLLAQAPGARVLDLGCYMGWVAEAFAAGGASMVDAVDLYLPGVENATALLAAHSVKYRVAQCDLRGGHTALDMALPGGARYDILLYLGLHHHLRRAMSKPALDSFVSALVERTGTYFVLRTKDAYFPDVEAVLEARGFRLWDNTPKTPHVGRLAIYTREK